MSMPARAVQLGMPGAMSTSAAIRLYDSPARGERVRAQARGCKLAVYFENAHAFIGDILSWDVNGVMSMYSMFGSRLRRKPRCRLKRGWAPGVRCMPDLHA